MDKKCQLTPKFRSVERNGRLPDILGAARVVHLRISPPGIPGQRLSHPWRPVELGKEQGSSKHFLAAVADVLA